MFIAVRREFVVEASLPVVWQHLSLVERWPTWARHIRRTRVDPAGPLGPDSSGEILLANGIRSTFRMAEYNPGVNWKWTGPFLWLHVHYDHRFERVSEAQTRLVWIVGVTGFGAPFFGRVFGAVYARNLDSSIPRLVSEIRKASFVAQ